MAIFWETVCSTLPRKLNKILWTSFLVNKRKRFDTIFETKASTFHLNTLLYRLCRNKAKIWACCCCKAWIAWLCCLNLLILYNELVMLLFSSFPFILLEENHFLTKPSTLFLSLVSISSFFPLFFSYFLSFLFFIFDMTVFFEYLLQFYVHFFHVSL